MKYNRLIRIIHLAALLVILAIATDTLLAIHLSACHHQKTPHDQHCQFCKVLSLITGHTIDLAQTILFAETGRLCEFHPTTFVPLSFRHPVIIPRAPPVS